MNVPLTIPQLYRFTREQYYQMLELGWFQDRRVELIDGEVVEMAAQSNFHLASITRTAAALQRAFGIGHWVRIQGTLDLQPLSSPDPDLAVIVGDPQGCGPDNPTTALLVVEVSDTTLSYDRGRKANLYAAAGIADYWIVNLVDGQLEVYRDVVIDGSQPFGLRYSRQTVLSLADTVAPLAALQASIPVADLFP